MSTPINQQSQKEKKPAPRQGQGTPKSQAAAPKSTPAQPKPERAAARPAQNAGKAAQVAAKAVNQPQPKAAASPTPKAATPPAPRPRDPSVARRDERREARRLEIQARQQERTRELRQMKRQRLLIRYDLIIAPILLIGLVALFLVIQQPIGALIAGLIIVFGAVTILAYATLMPTSQASRLARPRSPALAEAEVVERTISEGDQPPGAQTSEGEKAD